MMCDEICDVKLNPAQSVPVRLQRESGFQRCQLRHDKNKGLSQKQSTAFNSPVEEIGMWFIEQIETRALKLVVDRKEKHLPLLKGDTVEAFLEKMQETMDQEMNKHGYSREITAEHVVIIGDLYGQLFTLIAFLNEIKEHYADKGFKTLDESSFLFCDPSIQYVFLGNYVQWGESSVEVLLLLLAYKARCPQSLILLQGSEEGQTWWGDVFLDELEYKGHRKQAGDLKRLVRSLPYVAVAPKKFMCMHGGITPQFAMKCRDKAGRFDKCLDRDIGKETIWPDPFNGMGWKKGIARASGATKPVVYNFGMDIAMDFLKSNRLSKIFRSHEHWHSGFYELERDKYSVITLTSAPDPKISYCPSNSPPWMVNVTQFALPKPNEGAIAFIDSTDSKVTWTPVTMSLLTAKIKAEQLVPGARCDHS